MRTGVVSPVQRFEYNFACDHGAQTSVPPSLAFFPINEPERENDARFQAGECFTCAFCGGKDFPTSETKDVLDG